MLFSRNKIPTLQLSDSQCKEIKGSLLWLLSMFDKDALLNKGALIPNAQSFPIQYDSSISSAQQTLNIIAVQMEIDPAEIHLNVFSEGIDEINAGGNSRIFIQQGNRAGGLYWGKGEDGQYHVGLSNNHLGDPEGMVAVLAHELAHIKLLGEGRIAKNDEMLTDLTTIAFGLGVFNANVAFRFRGGYDAWSYSRLGYLSQMEWGYGLAVYANLRSEEEPAWLKYLTKNIQSDFKASMIHLTGGSTQ